MPWASLRPLLRGEGAELTLERLRHFALELLRWNRGVSNLISRDDEARLVERHVAESLAGAAIVRELGSQTLVDLGSGGGFPALPLAIAGVGRHWTLVESRRNKTLFLRRAIQELKLTGVVVLTGRLETLVTEERDALQCDGFTSRATLKVGPTLALAEPIVRPGGHAILWKGSGLGDELEALQAGWDAHWRQVGTTSVAGGQSVIALFERK